MADRKVIIAVLVAIAGVAFIALIVVLLFIYKFLKPKNQFGTPSDHISVQERGNSIYRDSAYSSNFNSLGLGSFGRGTLTFTRYQQQQQARRHNQQQEEEEPQLQDQSPVEDINQQPLQGQELEQPTAETTA